MLRSVVSKVMWVGRATVFLVGLAVVLALVLGVASTALGLDGQAFILGRSNSASSVSTLLRQGPGPALSLKVDSGSRPLVVNSTTKVNNLNADQLDGQDSTNFAAYKRTVVVSPTGTDMENGTALWNALAGITDASATKPYLLYIEPGIYDLGGAVLHMKPHVDIQGAGELQTLITSDESGCVDGALVRGANDVELRFLTVRNTGTGQCSAAIWNDHVSPRLTHVTAEATGAGGQIHYGVFNESSSVKMTDVTATASGSDENTAVFNIRGANISMTDVTAAASGESSQNFGLSDNASDTTMTDVTATASGESRINIGLSEASSHATLTNVTATASGADFDYGMMLAVIGTDVIVRQSKMSGTTFALADSSNDSNVALSQIVGPIDSAGNLRCFNNYDENLAAVTCP